MKKLRVLESLVSISTFKNFVEEIFLLSIRKQSSYVCVCNVHMLLEAKWDQNFNKILNKSDLTLPDGMPVAKVLSWKYNFKQERVSGMDILPILIEECSKRQKSIFFYGSSQNILDKIKQKIDKEYIDLRTNFFSPPFRDLNKKEKINVIHSINDFDPDFVFVCLGCPKQERWMSEHKNLINSCMIGLGGAFNVYAGVQRRAPKWMSNNSLEWLFRLILEPKRLFRRYFITNSLFIWYICKEFIKNNFK